MYSGPYRSNYYSCFPGRNQFNKMIPYTKIWRKKHDNGNFDEILNVVVKVVVLKFELSSFMDRGQLENNIIDCKMKDTGH